MTVFIDADGCPVVNIAVRLCRKYNLKCFIVCDTCHFFDINGAETVVVDKGSDSADIKLINMIQKGDIAITQDYALAAMCIAKKALAINQNGMVYNDSNIDSLLESRYIAKKTRLAGGRIKGPSKRTAEETEKFIQVFEQILKGD